MARNRKNKMDGFSFEDIVNTEFSNSTDDINVNNDININNDVNIIDKLKTNNDEKIKTLVYLDADVANHLDHYGELLGKKNGGKSKFNNESLKAFMIENNLWDEKIANKKRKSK